jgi:hypothetical protein
MATCFLIFNDFLTVFTTGLPVLPFIFNSAPFDFSNLRTLPGAGFLFSISIIYQGAKVQLIGEIII